jgi:hypothetical protein
MSDNKSGATELTQEQVERELIELKDRAKKSTSPVAIFMPIMQGFEWNPVTPNNPETSTIVLASDYGEIDNGCIIYNPKFIHKLYTEDDVATFYAIIATIGLGVKCGYYSFRNGEGIPHSVAVKMMLSHSGIFNSLKCGNSKFNQSIEALQAAYECPTVMRELKRRMPNLIRWLLMDRLMQMVIFQPSQKTSMMTQIRTGR